MLACLLIATAGELFLALAWALQLSRGRVAAVRAAGHVLLYMLGLALAERMPSSLVRPIGLSRRSPPRGCG